ncbi:MAG TPA: hypothetical protein VLE97_10650 [Gaiellaceae bacterium]|nr:hypothetical protein [Gaiellaceae bacterium]
MIGDDQIAAQIAAWLDDQAAREQALLDSGRCTSPERTQERWLVYKAAAQEVRAGAWAKTAPMPDEAFAAFVDRHREFGYGRMMHVISELWRATDPRGALSVGDTYGILEVKRARCAAEGHDVRHGNSYDWCDRCGAQLDPDSGKEPA